MSKVMNRLALPIAYLATLLVIFWVAALGLVAANQLQTAHAQSLLQIANTRPIRTDVVHDKVEYKPNELLVKLSGDQSISAQGNRLLTQDEQFSQLLSCYGFTKAAEIAPGEYKLSAPGSANLDVEAAALSLKAAGAVVDAGPNHLFYAMVTPNDTQYVAQQQWGVTQIHAEQAWDITTGSPNIIIAILDTGTATDHPDLESKIVPGHDFVNNDDNPYDDYGHGTYTAGIAAAESNNDTGIAGISWGARIMPIKVLSNNGSGSEEDIARGIRWAVDNHARIISASLGGDIDSTFMQEAVQYAYEQNVLIVASSGNTPDGNPNYPAAFDTVLAVGATGRSDTFTGFSSWGPFVDVTAPGVGILSTGWDRGNLDYEYGNGTSASCPFVSGVAALVMTVNPGLTAEQVKWIIEDSSDDFGDPGWDEHYGRGRVNALKAVQMAQQGPPAPRTPTSAVQATNTPAPSATKGPTQRLGIQVSATNVTPGMPLSIVGTGFGPNELIDLRLTSSNGKSDSLGNAGADGSGSFRAELALPINLPPGKATFEAVGARSALRASVELTISGVANAGQSKVQGTIKGVNAPSAVVRLKPAAGTPGSEVTIQAGSDGVFAFTGLGAGIYTLSVTAPGALPSGPHMVQVNGGPDDVRTLVISLSANRPAALEKVASIPSNKDQTYFPPVGHTLKGPFLKFWQSKGGLAIFGYPLTEEFDEISQTDGKSYKVQYFERNRFEYHPEFAGTPNEVLMGLLGVDSTRGRTFLPGATFQSSLTQAYFNETQHSLSTPFLKYWQTHGGLAVFGYPISEELSENGYRVQYFERNRFEYHPEFAGTPNEVLLGLLGVETMKRNGWIEQ